MAAALAALRGFIDIDDKPFEQGLRRAEGRAGVMVDGFFQNWPTDDDGNFVGVGFSAAETAEF